MERLLAGMSKIQKDKLLHMVYGTVIFLFLNLLLSDMNALLSVFLIATIKEVYDYLNNDKHTVDYKDALATVVLPMLIVLTEMLQ